MSGKWRGSARQGRHCHSTVLVDTNTDFVAAEFYKTFLHCAAKIIRSEDGAITSYDGDRVMAVYIGEHALRMSVTKAETATIGGYPSRREGVGLLAVLQVPARSGQQIVDTLPRELFWSVRHWL